MHKPHHKGGRKGPRSRRPLAHGDLRLLLLSLIQEAPRHGYDLITEIETRTQGAYKPSPGVIYPALEMLQDMGLAEMIPAGAKKSYHITQDGTTLLSDKADVIEQITNRLGALATPDENIDPSSPRAAMRRLEHAVKSHMHSDAVSDKQREEIVSVIEEARKKIASFGQG